jgi:hypothetical protein
MATSLRKRRVFTPQQRQEHVERFRRSGLRQAEFCRRAKLHPMTFSLWRRRAESAAPAFAEVQLSGPIPMAAAGAGAAILHLTGGARMEVALGGEAAWRGLGVMLRSLQA